MNSNPSDHKQNQHAVQPSKPIPISTLNFRHRSPSLSSDSSTSSTSSPPPQTPKNVSLPRIPTSTTGSPTLYFLSQSPSKSSPFRGFQPPPVLEDEPLEDIPPHARSRSISSAVPFQPQFPLPEPHHERGVNVLRRLSFGSALPKPQTNDIPQPHSPHPPPNSAVDAPPVVNKLLPGRKTRRSATIAEPTRQRRAPSPMGERILKGHFDGFN